MFYLKSLNRDYPLIKKQLLLEDSLFYINTRLFFIFIELKSVK